MRELILFRHAKAEAVALAGDRDRTLSESGRRCATEMGAKLAAEGVNPDLVLVSNSVRTRETWELASAAFPRTRLEIRNDLYEASVDDIAVAVEAVARQADVVIVVGHNPGLQTYAIELLKKGGAPARALTRIAAGFPPATAAVFAIDEVGRASLDALYDPRDLGCD